MNKLHTFIFCINITDEWELPVKIHVNINTSVLCMTLSKIEQIHIASELKLRSNWSTLFDKPKQDNWIHQ